MRKYLLYCLFAPPLALATNSDSEASFSNQTDKRAWCYFDLDGQLAVRMASPGERCKGDAMGFGYLKGDVFKAPNKTVWNVNEAGATSTTWGGVLMEAASFKNGADKYGWMSWAKFKQVMGL